MTWLGGLAVKKVGRLVGAGMAVIFGAAVAASFLVGSDDSEGIRGAAAAGLIVFSVMLPVGLWFGNSYDRLKRWAEQDTLTGACSRKFLQLGFPRLVKQADRKHKRFSVILIDVDDFKSINDTFGHARGDELLCKLAGVLIGAAEYGEIVGRWGGDEFVVLCPYGDAPSLDRLHRSLEERIEQLTKQWQRPVTISVGSAVYPEDGRLLDELTQVADRNMYRDKNRSKSAASAQRLQA